MYIENTALLAKRLARRRQRGMTLLLTLLIAGVLWVFSMGTLEVIALDLRVGRRSIEAVRLFHATDAALRVCETRIAAGEEPMAHAQANGVQPAPSLVLSPEPNRWRRAAALAPSAPGVINIVLPWQGQSLVVPCLAERWRVLPDAQWWLLTVRSPPAFGIRALGRAPVDEGTGVWLQSALEVGKATRRHWWRSVAEPPL